MIYEDEVLKTLSTEFRVDRVGQDKFSDAVTGFILEGEELDQIKRALYYGDKAKPALRDWDEPIEGLDINLDSQQILHAIMGIATEAAELLQAAVDAGFSKYDYDRTNIIEELGDLEYYMAVLRNKFGVSQKEVQERNVAKLQARYSGGFSSDAAVNRDTEKERSALEG